RGERETVLAAVEQAARLGQLELGPHPERGLQRVVGGVEAEHVREQVYRAGGVVDGDLATGADGHGDEVGTDRAGRQVEAGRVRSGSARGARRDVAAPGRLA